MKAERATAVTTPWPLQTVGQDPGVRRQRSRWTVRPATAISASRRPILTGRGSWPRRGGCWQVASLWVCSLFCALPSGAQNWVAVTSPNFEVYGNADVQDVRTVARELEVVRRIFQAALPASTADPVLPLVVIALDDRDDIPSLFPQLRGGRSSVAGVFRSSRFEHHIVLGTNGRGRGRFQVVYHEYFHLLSTLTTGHLPPWLTEGLAEVYSNLTVRGDTVEIGDQRRDYLNFLNTRPLLPLDTLIAADANPHGAGDFEATRFYAQAWALTHYLLLGDAQGTGRALVTDYIQRIGAGMNPRAAFTESIGSLADVTRALRGYIRRGAFYGMRMDTPESVHDDAFESRALSDDEALAVQAGVLAQGTQPKEAFPLLQRALSLNPDSTRAYESLGLMHVQRGESTEAATAFTTAIALGSDRFLPHYLAAVFELESRPDADRKTVERWLRLAIDMRPGFASPHALLAGILADARPSDPEATVFARRAVELEPTELQHWLVLGEVLLARGDLDGTRVAVVEAQTWIHDPAEKQRLQALARRVGSADVILARAQLLRSAGAFEAAAAAYRQAIRQGANTVTAHNGLGWTLFELGDLDDATAAHRAALAIDPNNTDAHRAMGAIFVKLGQLDEAENSFRKAVASDSPEPPR